ncbi:MAG: FAD-binding oxidoreductase [Bryobacterales bacterium]|nr:FAD-binding oxidoreductase [Bryobacterales bacterium]MBV9397267.1 FAD-binding oxidoreductase [Bryobacterales bacterium]
MQMFCPESPEQLAEALREAAGLRRTIRLGGNFSKDRLGGSICPAGVTLSTHAMKRLLQYDPKDLTVSVQAGMAWTDLERTLDGHRQMLPLDPGWANESTVGGVVAANLSGPRRRLYGTARDMIIGMKFATLEGKLIDSGGMVVKNVAGLDMAKLMIGSFGTLAAVAVVNFKVFPIPEESRTFEMRFETAAQAFGERDRILQSHLQPTALDIVNWPSGFRLLVRAGGHPRVIERYTRELPRAEIVNDSVWNEVREFTPRFLVDRPQGAVIPIASKLTQMPSIAQNLAVPFIARAGSGVIYAHHAESPQPADLGGAFEMMTKIKQMFDPGRLLNRGRLYGRI